MARKKTRNYRRKKSRRSRRRRFVGGNKFITYVKLIEKNKGLITTNFLGGMILHFQNGEVTYGSNKIPIGTYIDNTIDEGYYNVQPIGGVPFYGSKDINQDKTLIAHVKITNEKAVYLSTNAGYSYYIPLKFEKGKVTYGKDLIGDYNEIIGKEGEGDYIVEPFDINMVPLYGVKVKDKLPVTVQKTTPVNKPQDPNIYGMMPDNKPYKSYIDREHEEYEAAIRPLPLTPPSDGTGTYFEYKP